MDQFSLTNTVFRMDANPPVAVGLLYFDTEVVREILYADIDTDTDMFSMEHMDGGAWAIKYLGGYDGNAGSIAFDIDVFVEYVAVNGRRERRIPSFRLFGTYSEGCLPEIHHIDNLATRIGSAGEVTLHCHNLTHDNIDGLAVFLVANSGEKCIRIAPEEIVYDFAGDGSEECVTRDQTATFVVTPRTFSDGDEQCGTYDIMFGYGDTCVNATLLENSTTTRNLSLIRFKFDAENSPATGNNFTGEGNCWFTSPITLVEPSVGGPGDGISTGAGDGLGGDIYVRGIGYECPCENIEYFYVRLVYTTRLDYRRGEMTLDGVSLREGDIVWLAGQMDSTDGLWRVMAGDWQGMGTPVNNGTTSPCFDITPPRPVDCSVFIDPGVRVQETVKTVCSDDVPVKNGTQTVCGGTVHPGDIIVLENQIDGGNGLWRVTCGDWEFLGSDFERSDDTVDLSRSVTVQTDIDFCKCGGIFHIDYYYLNTGCYLNHARRTVKVMCGGASVAPNNERQFIITDYKITDGANGELMDMLARTPGDPVPEDCVLVDKKYEYGSQLKTGETRSGCVYVPGTKSPDCMDYCDCERSYTLSMTTDYKTSADSNGFTIVFWQLRDDGWHLYAYVAAGNANVGIEYYVMHLKDTGAAVVGNIEYNREISWVERDAKGNVKRDDTGSPITIETHDAWFVPHLLDGDGQPSTDLTSKILAEGFGLVDDGWAFPKRDEHGKKIPHEFTSELGPNTLYENWQISDTTRLLCTKTDDAVHGMRGIWGFKYYGSVVSADDFVKMYNRFSCR